MKKILLIIMALLVVILLSGCSTMEKIPEKERPTNFMVYEECGSGAILVDRDTHVMYWVSTSTYNYGNLTLLVNADGSPKIWSGD